MSHAEVPENEAITALEAKASLYLKAASASQPHAAKRSASKPRAMRPNEVPSSQRLHIDETLANHTAAERMPSGVVSSPYPATGSTTTYATIALSPPLAPRPQTERASYLDVSALSPEEYTAFVRWVDKMKPAHSRRRGLLDEHAAIKFLRSEFGIHVNDEVTILSMFERLPLGLTAGHVFAMLRLAAWAQQGQALTKDLIFVQTRPPEPRRRPRNARESVGGDFHEPRTAPGAYPPPVLIDVPKAPPPQLPGPRRDEETGAYEPDHADTHSVTSSRMRLVRPKPVVARTSLSGAANAESIVGLPRMDGSQRHPSRASLRAPDSPVLGMSRSLLDRPSAPNQTQQVSPLIQASLNARSEKKKAARATRPKTFTVLSSSRGQVPRATRLLTGQEVSLQSPSHAKFRTPSMAKMRSPPDHDTQLLEDEEGAVTDERALEPKPSYLGSEHCMLPTWLREQQEEGNVLYAPDVDVSPSVFEALDDKVHESMNGSERAAASINRNTPFFPPHKRDLDRVARSAMDGSGPEHYRALNAHTSAINRASSEAMGEAHTSVGGSRAKSSLTHKLLSFPPRRRTDAAWGTTLEAGTYAGFKSTPSARDLRLQTPRKELGSKRSNVYPIPPSQEFQPRRTPKPDAAATEPSDETMAETSGENDEVCVTEHTHAASEPVRTEPAAAPRRQPHPKTELPRFILQEEVTRPQLVHPVAHARKTSGSYGIGYKTWPKPDTPAAHDTEPSAPDPPTDPIRHRT